jgi:plastocyanin
MMFAKKCPKCGGNVQTKSLKKSIGLGFVNIPVAQFCLNPVCDWYQDFAETKEPEEIKEGFQIKVPSIKSKLPELKKPNLSQKHFIALAAVVVIIGIYILFSYLSPTVHSPGLLPQQPDVPKTNMPLVNTTHPPVAASPQTPAVPQVIAEQKKYSIKFDVSHGFNPKVLTINRSDTVIWNNDENQRPRVVLVSKDGLFKNRLMEYSEKYQYQFNQSGSYIFVQAEYPSLNEYPNATNEIIVK